MSTEIQKVPGTFNLPANWPKLEIPDLVSNVYADFRADSLPLGVLAQWSKSAGTATWSLKPSVASVSTAPVVSRDSGGRNRVVFEGGSRLDSVFPETEMLGDVSYVVTAAPMWSKGTDSVRLVSGSGTGYRAVNHSTGAQFLFRSSESPEARTADVGVETPSGTITTVGARFTSTEVSGKAYGQPNVVTAIPTGPVLKQTNVFVGASGSAPPAGLFWGSIYRIQIWKRALSNLELDAAMAENAVRYGIPAR